MWGSPNEMILQSLAGKDKGGEKREKGTESRERGSEVLRVPWNACPIAGYPLMGRVFVFEERIGTNGREESNSLIVS